MNINVNKNRYSGWILDLIPGAAAAQLFGKLPIFLHLPAVEAGVSLYLAMTLGFCVLVVASFLLRTLATKTIKNRTIANVLGAAISLGLAGAVIAVVANIETPSAVLNPMGSSNSHYSPPTSPADTAITAQTMVQDAGGATDDAITTNEVGRWVAYLNAQCGTSAQFKGASPAARRPPGSTGHGSGARSGSSVRPATSCWALPASRRRRRTSTCASTSSCGRAC